MTTFRRAAAGLLLATFLATPHVATAADPKVNPASPPAYSIVRWDENYSYLKDPANRTDFFDPIKYIPLGADSYVSLGGAARYRYEYFNNNNFGAGPQDTGGFNLTRLLAHADLHLTSYFRAFVQGKSAMEDGRDTGPRGADADEVDVQQAFADAILPVADKSSLTLRFGRQELIYGAQRLISPSNWANVMRTFEGFKASLATAGNTLDAFWVRPVLINNEEPNDGDGNTSFAGLYNTMALPDFLPKAGTKFELYALALNQSPGGTRDADTYTLGTRLSSKPKPWDFDVETAYQFGDTGGNSICAYSVAIDGGYTFANLPLTPRASLGFDIASGSPDGSGRFNQLFPSGHHYFGYIDVVARENIIDLHPGLTLTVTKNVTFRAENHFFWRQNVGDGLYNAQGALLRAANGSDAPFIGSEIDLLLTWQIDRHTTASVGYSHFFTGEFIEQTGPDQNIDFLYAAVDFVF